MRADEKKKVTRRERERKAHKEEILDTAEEIFAQKGFVRASVQDIAEKADFSVGTIYYFFESKENLYDEVINRRLEQAYEIALKALAGKTDPPSMIRSTLEAQLSFLEKHRHLGHLLVRETVGLKMGIREFMTDGVSRAYDRYQELLLDIFRAGVKSGHFADKDPSYMMLAFIGIVFSFIAHHLEQNLKEDLVELLPRIEEVFYGSLKGPAMEKNTEC
jgi:AcrR family transcriptional regulator